MATNGSADSDESHGRKRRKTTEGASMMLDEDDDHLREEDDVDVDEEPEEGVNQVEPLEGLKHADGSIYEKIDFYCWTFRLGYTEETSLQPMKLTLPTTECQQPTCARHVGSPMLQIFSVKLTKLPRSCHAAAAVGPIQLYGFMAIRDLKDPLRNYVFNRSREDPLVIPGLHSDPFIYLSGPKRGVDMQARVAFEYDVRIRREFEDDLPLIDGVAIFSERVCIDEPATFRIAGHRGAAVDVRRARFLRSMEATVQVWIRELPLQQQQGGVAGGLELSISAGFAHPETMIAADEDEIKLFRGTIQKPCALNRFVVAVPVSSSLVLQFRAVPPAGGAGGGGGGSSFDRIGEFAFEGRAHGSTSDCRKFDFATVEVKVTWSPMH